MHTCSLGDTEMFKEPSYVSSFTDNRELNLWDRRAVDRGPVD